MRPAVHPQYAPDVASDAPAIDHCLLGDINHPVALIVPERGGVLHHVNTLSRSVDGAGTEVLAVQVDGR
jgi:hypothetical protein